MELWIARQRQDRDKACGRFNAAIYGTGAIDRMAGLGRAGDSPARRSAWELPPGPSPRAQAPERTVPVFELDHRHLPRARNCRAKPKGSFENPRSRRHGARRNDVGRRQSFGGKSSCCTEAFRSWPTPLGIGLALALWTLFISSHHPLACRHGALSVVQGGARPIIGLRKARDTGGRKIGQSNDIVPIPDPDSPCLSGA